MADLGASSYTGSSFVHTAALTTADGGSDDSNAVPLGDTAVAAVPPGGGGGGGGGEDAAQCILRGAITDAGDGGGTGGDGRQGGGETRESTTVSLTAIRQKFKHLLRLKADVARARAAAVVQFELAVPASPIAATGTGARHGPSRSVAAASVTAATAAAAAAADAQHRHQEEVCTPSAGSHSASSRSPSPSFPTLSAASPHSPRQAARAAFQRARAHECVALARAVQERQATLREVAASARDGVAFLKTRTVLLEVAQKLCAVELLSQHRLMLQQIRTLFQRSPIVAVRLSPTEVEWVFRFEVVQHERAAAAAASAAAAAAAAAPGGSDHHHHRHLQHHDPLLDKQGYTRHHESAFAAVRLLVGSIRGIVFAHASGGRRAGVLGWEGRGPGPGDATTAGARADAAAAPSPLLPARHMPHTAGEAVAAIRNLCRQASTLLAGGHSASARDVDLRGALQALAAVQFLSAPLEQQQRQLKRRQRTRP